MTEFHIDIEKVENMVKVFGTAGQRAEAIVNDVLHNEAGPIIETNIMQLLPQSGRIWKGKKPAAKNAAPFQEVNGNLSVTVTTKSNYHYLYFPDDGSNTKRHVGNQQFMFRGAEQAAPDIINLCTARIVKEIGG